MKLINGFTQLKIDNSVIRGHSSCLNFFHARSCQNSADIFFPLDIFEKLLSGVPSELDQAESFVRPDLGSNSLQWLSAEYPSGERVIASLQIIHLREPRVLSPLC